MHRWVLLAFVATLGASGLLGPSEPSTQAQANGVALVQGINVVVYRGPTAEVSAATASVSTVLRAIWRFDNETKAWSAWAATLPEPLRGFSDLVSSEIYFVDVRTDSFWTFSGAGATTSIEFSFANDSEGWTTGFADLPAEFDPELFDLAAGHRPLPAELVGSGVFLQGHNRSDDLLMFATRRLAGLTPGQRYRVIFDLDLVTSVLGGGVGIGGAPGESVFVKVGGASFAPATTVDELGTQRLNWDVGIQSNDGEHAIVLGNVALPDGAATTIAGWGVKRLGIDGRSLEVMADETGTLWLFVGTDSGFEGLTQLHFGRIGVRLEPVP
ncbi:MAG TPA: hypothetical protein QGF05_00690 [Dehalococcoidia bacterium]|nr:hypothetical protein [Dehalococcoidia bacterium]